MGYDDAMQYVRLQVEKIHKTISHEGAVAICGVGTLKASPGRSYEFTPLLCGILSPRHYGLDSLYAPAFHAEEPEAAEKEEELQSRLPAELVETAKDFSKLLSVVPDSRVAMEVGVSAMHDVTEGGIFGALWEMGAAAGVGLEVDLKKIPIRQETVEVCEVFDINPYLLISSGSMLIGTDHGS